MTRKRQSTEPKRATLQVPRSEAEARIRKQIEKGRRLLELQMRNKAELEQARSERTKWSDFNAELLKRVVDTDDLLDDYDPGFDVLSLGPIPFAAEVEEFYSDVKTYITRLESILSRLELIPESPALAQPRKEQPETLSVAQVFLCYAEEDEERVENLYQKLSDAGFKPWMAKKDILPGEMWKLSIQEAMRLSDFIVVCLSATSVNKRSFIQKEIKDALDIWREKLESDIYLIPVRLEDCEVPESLRDFQWVSLFEENGWTRLVKAIQVGMERRAETSAKSVAEAEQPEHEQRPVFSLHTVTSTESAVPEAVYLKMDSIKWDKSGNLFWASHDLMWTIDALLTGAPRETIGYGLRQSLHHVRALGFNGPPIESKLAKLTARAEETIDWTPSLRSSYAVQLASIKDAIGDLASANQPDFDSGPKK